MNDENLEITKELYNLEDIENNPESPAIDIETEIIDINEKMDSIEETIESIDKLSDEVKDIKPKKKLKDKIKDKWNTFSKKKKTAIIIIGVLFMLLIVTLSVLAIVFLNKDEKTTKKQEESIIFEADNYRYENGYLILLDKNDKELGKYECKNKDEKLCYVAYYETDELLDTPKKVDEEGNILEMRSEIINDSFVFINDTKTEKDKKVVLYDIKNNETLEAYNAIKSIKDKYAVVKDYSDSYGVIEFADEVSTIIDFNYDNIAILSDGEYIIVNESGRNYLVDSTEKAMSKAISMNIVNYNNKYIVGIDDSKKYYLYDYKNTLIFDDSFDYIKLYDEYALLIKDKEIYLNYYDGKKVTENGYDIKLEHPYYQKTYIFDEDNNLIEEYEPFALVEENNTITLTIGEEDYVINKLESKISSSIEYINYFDGVLYFYDNTDKTNLIGTYKCNNKNVLSEDSTTFNNCFIASDTSKQDNDMTTSGSSGMIPILNHRYVFIKDNPNAVSEGNTNIVLYDLTNKKTIAKYTSVNTGLNTNLDKPSFVTQSNIYIIAKNKNGYYGVITLNADSQIASLISFNNKYKSIENIGNNYLVSDSNGYSLFDKNGKELTKKVSNKIRGYNSKYLKVLENNSYYVYDYEGKKITTTGYKYIELYDNYFAAVDSSNKLNIYSYTDVSKALLKDAIALSSNKYYGDGQLAFKITITGTTAKISVLNSGTYTESVYSLIPEVKVEPVTPETEKEENKTDSEEKTETTSTENETQSEVNNE